MTPDKLRGIAWRHGYRVVVRDNQPSLKKVRADAMLPDRIRWLFVKWRHLFIDAPPPTLTAAEEEFIVKQAGALLAGHFGPVQPTAFHREDGTRIPCRHLAEVFPNPAPGEPPF